MTRARPSDSTRQAPSRLGRYRLEEQLGAGGMATVHRAVVEGAMGFARPVVLKRILPELARDPRFVEMMVSEARVCSQLRHPSIVQVHDFGEVDGQLFLAMELIEGHDLSTVLRRCRALGVRFPPALAAFLIAELAGALAYAHALRSEEQSMGIVHRDVSPSNVMMTTLGGVKLLDFGIAKAIAGVGDARTRTGVLKGKVAYMSPEQADGLTLDGRSDQFSLGVVFWEGLMLRPLFKESSDFATLRRIRTGDVVAPARLESSIDPRLDEIVMRMLATDPAKRYETCDAVAAALSPILHETHTDARVLRDFLAELEPIPRFEAEPTPDDAEGTSVERLRPPTRRSGPRRRARLLPALGVGLTLAGLATVAYTRARRTSTTPVIASAPASTPSPAPTVQPARVVDEPAATIHDAPRPARRATTRGPKSKAPEATAVHIKNPFGGS